MPISVQTFFFSETIKTDVKNNILHVGSFDKRKNIGFGKGLQKNRLINDKK